MAMPPRVPFLVAALLILVLSTAAAVSAQAANPRVQDLALEYCSSHCLGLETNVEITRCLRVCDNAASSCVGTDEVTLRSEDVVPMWMNSHGSCHGTTSCSGYPSCASWSGYYDCGAPFCGIYKWCPEDCEGEFGCWGPALRQPRERFRVCFNAAQEACTEYQSGGNLVVGCDC